MILAIVLIRENLVYQDLLVETDCLANEGCLVHLDLWDRLEKTATKVSQESQAKKVLKALKVTLDLLVRLATLGFEENWVLSVHLAREDHLGILVEEEAKARMGLRVPVVLQDLLVTKVFQGQQVSKEKKVILVLKAPSDQLVPPEMQDHRALKVYRDYLGQLAQKEHKDPRVKQATLVLLDHLAKMGFM